ncbi:NAD(P)/FAD-dependent oxidoreductase [Terrihabitans rhizophilus]|uniref:FAD-dependent oxidoreductase n=1 Tax=Terrihabitans rhizophilus TaxID=3092662 RepID=A0ABU4RM19_9HYPH|nr:FAD-dependent oxidoreductase [Terrihabitans sp. PJ23]MDX6805866.1 FAD-dependent oxidoreductase [Terrihabitans sp. PJ23]
MTNPSASAGPAEHLVVVGNGMAGIRTVEDVLRRAPGRFRITVIGAEPHAAYNRVMLSPVLAGEKRFADIISHGREWYAANGVQLRTGTPVTGVDRDAKTLCLGDSETLDYDRLVLATGSHAVVLPVPGRDLPGVIAFRDAADVDAMLAAARPGARAVVIGGGLLGLEAANGLLQRGMAVTVLHLMPHLMERQLDAEAASLLRAELEGRGIAVLTSAVTEDIFGAGRAEGVRLADGRVLAADLVVMAVGVRPNADLARAAGLDVGRGVIVDDHMQTSDPSILAVGECVEHAGACYGLVAPLYDMAAVLADTLAGTKRAYLPAATATRLKVTGIDLFSAGDFAPGADREEVVLRDPARGVYRRLVLRDDRLVGAVLYGDTMDGNFFFDLIASGADISRQRDDLIFGPLLCAAA